MTLDYLPLLIATLEKQENTCKKIATMENSHELQNLFIVHYYTFKFHFRSLLVTCSS